MTHSRDRPFHRDKKAAHFAYSDKHPAQHINGPHAEPREKPGTALVLHICVNRTRDLRKTGHNVFKPAAELGPDPIHVIADRRLFG